MSILAMRRAVARMARLSPGVSESDVDGGDMATWKARAAARVSGTRTMVMDMVVSGCTWRILDGCLCTGLGPGASGMMRGAGVICPLINVPVSATSISRNYQTNVLCMARGGWSNRGIMIPLSG